MTLIDALIDALYTLSVTNQALVAGGFLGALVIAYALMLAACITVRVVR
jgi:hypothetical protein